MVSGYMYEFENINDTLQYPQFGANNIFMNYLAPRQALASCLLQEPTHKLNQKYTLNKDKVIIDHILHICPCPGTSNNQCWHSSFSIWQPYIPSCELQQERMQTSSTFKSVHSFYILLMWGLLLYFNAMFHITCAGLFMVCSGRCRTREDKRMAIFWFLMTAHVM